MATAKQPQDHKVPRQQVEAQDGLTTLEWKDMSFTVSVDPMDLDGDFLKYAADGDGYRMVQTVLDAKQFAQFKKAKPTVRDYNEVGDLIADLYGFDAAGE